jgi:FtsZ-interacting cell division protein YlmF
MSNTKVQPHKKKKSRTYSIENRVFEDLKTIADELGVAPSVIVNKLIKDYNIGNLK